MSNKIRESPKPAYCSSCFGQPEGRYIDFGAYWDGPVLDGSRAIQIDDLIICEHCLKEAALLVGFTDRDDRAELERLRESNGHLREERVDLLRRINTIERAFQDVPQAPQPKPTPRPKKVAA